MFSFMQTLIFLLDYKYITLWIKLSQRFDIIRWNTYSQHKHALINFKVNSSIVTAGSVEYTDFVSVEG